jgi:hypothetical protein
VDEGVETPWWLHCWLETILEYGDMEVDWVEESWLPHNHGKTPAYYVLGLFDDVVLTVLAELSYFYRQLCAKEITVEMMQKLEKEILVLLCTMEKNFPPEFFNPMQHLLIHLPYEAKVGGPVQYRWMYHIERALRYLKPMVDNRARVEGWIAETFTLKEVAYFSSVYFAKEHNVNAPTMRYNVDEEPPYSDLSIFASRGTTIGSSTSYYSTSEERKAALLYMYANIDGMDKYFE